MEFQHSLIINRPLPTVFTLAADFENWPKWECSYLQVKRQSSGTNALGAVYRSKRKVASIILEALFVVVVYAPERKLTIVGQWAGFLKPVLSFHFEPVPEGTRITYIAQPQLRGLFQLLRPIIARLVQRRHEEYLNNLKRLAESQ
jgi:hypothetical protein